MGITRSDSMPTVMAEAGSPMFNTFEGLGFLDSVHLSTDLSLCLDDLAKFATANFVDYDEVSIETPDLFSR